MVQIFICSKCNKEQEGYYPRVCECGGQDFSVKKEKKIRKEESDDNK